MLEDWQRVMDWIAVAFDIYWPIPPEAARAEIENFLTRELRHLTAGSDRALARYTWPKAVYKAALAWLDDEQTATIAFDAIRPELMASDEFLAPLLVEYRYQGIAQLTAEIQRLTDSKRSRDDVLARHRDTFAKLDAELSPLSRQNYRNAISSWPGSGKTWQSCGCHLLRSILVGDQTAPPSHGAAAATSDVRRWGYRVANW